MKGSRVILYLGPTILLWGATPLLVTELTTGLPVLWVNTWACLLAALTLGALVALRSARGTGAGAPRSLGPMLVQGLTGLFPYIALLFAAYSLAPESASEVNIVNYTWPVWVVVLSALMLKEPLGPRGVVGLVLSFGGAALVITGGSLGGFRVNALPAFLAVGAGAFIWAWYSVRGKALGLEPITATAVAFAVATVCFIPIAALTSPFRLPTPRELALLLVLGAGVNGVGYLLWSLALRGSGGARVTSVIYLTPFVALGWLWVFGRATPRWYQPVALLLVVAGALLQRAPGRAPGPTTGRATGTTGGS